MKVFILGHHQTGRTTVAKALSDSFHYIAATSWVGETFRSAFSNETDDEYQAEYERFYFERLKNNPYLVIDNICDVIDSVDAKDFVIDGINNPKDFAHLFSYEEDIAVFLNRTDAYPDPKDYDGVAVNVMRDYCLYLVTTGLLSQTRWLEYNYKIPGENSNFVKQLGKHNTITITKSISTTISHLKGELCKFQI